ncbi:MAG TPA: agmatine deiminase family protein [Gemmatimonadales bacterium]|nr:agmatine deiminase family protein [Gemmatimonadales bacterium]
MPAEWEPQEAVWLSWPRRSGVSFPGDSLDWALPEYAGFARALARFTPVYINVSGPEHEAEARAALGGGSAADVFRFFTIPTDEPWVRDHGPSFLVGSGGERGAACFRFNAWGEKYAPYDADARAGAAMAAAAGARRFDVGLAGEGGAIEVNGRGTVLTTASSLLNPNRNPGIPKISVERALSDALGAPNVVWLEAELAGDDTDGHVDTFARFTAPGTIAASLPDSPGHPDFPALSGLHRALAGVRLEDGSKPEVVALPVPAPFVQCSPGGAWEPVSVPAGYANFLVTGRAVLVPAFGDPADDRAADVLGQLFPGREIVPLASRRLIWALGSFHCLSQQLPA